MSKIDFEISEDGGIDFNYKTRDLYFVKDDELRKQISCNRLRSIVGDWFNSSIGADLEKYLGEENSIETSEKIISTIMNSLTYDGFLSEDELYFIPSIKNERYYLSIFIKKKTENAPIKLELEINSNGVVLKSEVN